MIGRRGLLAGGAALATTAPARGIAPPTDIRFDVMRNSANIGQHVVTFRQDGDTLVATVVVQIVLRVGPLVLYRYTHSVRETWRGDRFFRLESDTDDNGKPFQVRAASSADHVVVEALNAPRAVFAAGTIPLTHWNIRCTERPLFNPQDGLPVESAVVPRGTEMVAMADGRMVRAARYSLVGKTALDDWYDDARQWTALRIIGRDGSTIDYRRVT